MTTERSEDSSPRERRPALVVALERGALDDVPIAIACVFGTALMCSNSEWRAVFGTRADSLDRDEWLNTFDSRDRDALVDCLASPGDDIDVRLTTSSRSERRVRARIRPVGDRVDYSVITIASIGLGADSEARLTHLATHDEMTGLVNRSNFVASLTARLDTATTPVGVLFIDLDGFKVINDNLGHRFGDAVLRAVADRVRSAVRDGDVVGRLGGDELAVFCPQINSSGDLVHLAERINQEIGQPFTLETETVMLGASIGIAVSSSRGTSAAALVDAADAAMYVAKDAGGSGWAVTEEPTLPHHDRRPERGNEEAEEALTITDRSVRRISPSTGPWRIRSAFRRALQLGRASAEVDDTSSAATQRKLIDDEVAAKTAVAQAHGIIAQVAGVSIAEADAALRSYSGDDAAVGRIWAETIVGVTGEMTAAEVWRHHTGGSAKEPVEAPSEECAE